ncbi:MAG: 4'-phosphopantetheinyl transferase superfamily protein [Chloroflexales bacterium]|nr:4'-phosphopantetheinyl transferase superfamily protein [Chloroflexales bacterium]
MTDPIAPWAASPNQIMLTDGEVHLWRVELDLPPAQLARLAQSLAADEQERAGRFHFAKDRNHYIAARGALRLILSRCLGIPAAILRFTYSSYGKPSLSEELGGSQVCFNLSHSHGIALYALAKGQSIGVDIEHIRPDLASDQIAERFFAPGEVAALHSLPVALRAQAFFNCWTRKEAYIKARGEGLSLPLDQFTVSLLPGEPAALLTASDPSEVNRWSLHALTPASGYVAALAVAGGIGQVRYWDLAL